MSAISGFINTIRNAVYGEQVRGAIANAIEQCYDDVSSPALNTAAFATAIAEAYADGFLDIQEKSTIAGMTNEKIIYRYTGNAAGYIHNALYYYDGTAWVPIGSGLQTASTAAQMTNTNVIYLYTGTESGYKKNALYYYNGTAWTQVSDVKVDDTLTQAGKAADAKAVGEVLGFGAEGDYDISDSTLWERKTIYEGSPQASTTTIKLIDFLPTNIRNVSVSAPYGVLPFRYTANGEYVGFLTENGFATDEAAAWARSFYVPNDEYRYLILVKNIDSSGATVTTSAASSVTTASGGLLGDVDSLKQEVSNILKSATVYWNNRTVSDSWVEGKGVSLNKDSFGTLNYNIASVCSASPFIDIAGAKLLKYTAMRTSDTGHIGYGTVLYDENKNPIAERGIASPHYRQTGDDYVVTQYLFVPENAKYMRTTYWTPSFISSNNLQYFSYSSIPIPDEWKPFTHELPLNPDMMNVVKRARQMSDIKWTPRVDIARYCLADGTWANANDPRYGHFLDWFKAGKEYVGLPYSAGGTADENIQTPNSSYIAGQWGYLHFWLGLSVDFETFVTAARYPNSIMGVTTEQASPDINSSPYGIFCMSLVHYALGGYNKYPYPSSGWFKPNDYSENMGSLPSFGVNNLRTADVLVISGHHAIITDIAKGVDGSVVSVEVTEATTIGNGNNSIHDGSSMLGGIVRRKGYTPADLTERYGAYHIYRFYDFNDIEYTQSSVVAVGNELDMERIIDYACIPYLGNKAKYKYGYIVNSKILIGATGYTNLVVTKDGETFGTFPINGQTEIEVGFTDRGSYSAYLTTTNGTTRPCTWTVE